MLMHIPKTPLTRPWLWHAVWAVLLLTGALLAGIYYSLTATTVTTVSSVLNPICDYAVVSGSSETWGPGIENFNPDLVDEVDCASSAATIQCYDSDDNEISTGTETNFMSRCATTINTVTMWEDLSTPTSCAEHIGDADYMRSSPVLMSGVIRAYISPDYVTFEVELVLRIKDVGSAHYVTAIGASNTNIPGESGVVVHTVTDMPLVKKCMDILSTPENWADYATQFAYGYTTEEQLTCTDQPACLAKQNDLQDNNLALLFGFANSQYVTAGEDMCETAAPLTKTQSCKSLEYRGVTEVLLLVGIVIGTLHGYVSNVVILLDDKLSDNQTLERLDTTVHDYKDTKVGGDEVQFTEEPTDSVADTTQPADEEE